ncbi:hypothetical protein BDV29DRAFT_174621 [Aspergillus leporis]|uniref:Uncharacterized protein n=1 Tax=Aspergillus leporis TaxID=41062 RepID=A0A5N5X1E5_9EURO|nr:hypothetical protein BDV29DRAFT_174621 [Aspergillus leporis]
MICSKVTASPTGKSDGKRTNPAKSKLIDAKSSHHHPHHNVITQNSMRHGSTIPKLARHSTLLSTGTSKHHL